MSTISGQCEVTPGRQLGLAERLTRSIFNLMAVPVVRVAAASITARELSPDVLSGVTPAAGSVGTDALIDGAVTALKLAANPWVDVASAAPNIGAADSINVRLTGTDDVTGFDAVDAGIFRRVRFEDALTLTYDGTALILPGLGNILTAAGDVAWFVSEGSGNWRCLGYNRASGRAVAVAFTRTHLDGLEVSNNASDADHDLDVAAGECRDGSDAVNMALTAGLTKRMDVEFVEGTNAGGFATGETLPTSGTIHIWVIAKVDGTTDVFANDHGTSGLTPTLPTGFVYKRFIGSWRTDASANIIPGVWDGDLFIYTSSIVDVDVTNSGTTAVSRSLSVPHGYAVLAKYRAGQSRASGHVYHRFSSLDTSDDSVTGGRNASLRGHSTGSGMDAGEFETKTNNAGQIRTIANAGGTDLFIDLIGYRFDRRKL